jgi:hypothetical protein
MFCFYKPNLITNFGRVGFQWIIRSRKSKKDTQYNDQKKSDKMTNNDLQNIYQQNITFIFTNVTCYVLSINVSC